MSFAGRCGGSEPNQDEALSEPVLECSNLQRALKQVRRNQGAPGIDGKCVDQLPEYLEGTLAGDPGGTDFPLPYIRQALTLLPKKVVAGTDGVATVSDATGPCGSPY